MSDDRTATPALPTLPASEEVHAFIPVRVNADRARPDGSVLVYLPDGTGLAVPRRLLVFADAHVLVGPNDRSST
jgi:hypothetical protein